MAHAQSMLSTHVSVAFAAVAFTTIIVKFVKRSRHLTGLPGPGNPSFVTGHFEDLGNARCGTRYNVWMKEYGKAYRLWAPFGVRFFRPPAGFCSVALPCRNTDSEATH